jgi:site-specific DNA recombinase
MKAAIYCRVSTEGQEQDETSLQTQLEACRKYRQARRYEVEH